MYQTKRIPGTGMSCTGPPGQIGRPRLPAAAYSTSPRAVPISRPNARRDHKIDKRYKRPSRHVGYTPVCRSHPDKPSASFLGRYRRPGCSRAIDYGKQEFAPRLCQQSQVGLPSPRPASARVVLMPCAQVSWRHAQHRNLGMRPHPDAWLCSPHSKRSAVAATVASFLADYPSTASVP